MPKPPILHVLADRYASSAMAAIWSPEHKIVLEQQLWLAVLGAQRDLGVDVPDGAIGVYERVLDAVDLASIAARERISRHGGRHSRDWRARVRPGSFSGPTKTLSLSSAPGPSPCQDPARKECR